MANISDMFTFDTNADGAAKARRGMITDMLKEDGGFVPSSEGAAKPLERSSIAGEGIVRSPYEKTFPESPDVNYGASSIPGTLDQNALFRSLIKPPRVGRAY